jgi:hypothetical protein
MIQRVTDRSVDVLQGLDGRAWIDDARAGREIDLEELIAAE